MRSFSGPDHPQASLATRSFAAILLAAGAVTLRLGLEGLQADIPGIVLAYIAVLASALYLGLVPAIAALVAGAILYVLFIGSVREHPSYIVTYLLVGSGLIGVAEAYRRAAQRAREASQRYQAFVTHSSEGIYRIEFEPPVDTSLPIREQIEQIYARGRLAECNNAFAFQYGHDSCEGSLGQPLDAMLPRSDPRSIEWIETIIRSGYRIHDAESIERDRHGNTIWIHNSLQGFVENGKLVRAWGTQREVSHRRRAEAALLREQDFLRSTIDASPSLIFVKDLEGRFILANKALAEVYGTTPEAILGKTDADYSPNREEVEQFKRADQAVILNRQPLEIQEEPVTDTSGVTRWFSTVKVPLLEPDGSCSRLLGIATDITQRKRAEERQRQTEDRLRAVFNQQYQFMALLHPDGSVMDINELPLRVAGITREEVLGRPFWDTPWWRDLPDMRKDWPLRLARAAGADHPIFSDDQYQDSTGQVRRADSAITAVRDPRGNVEFFIVQASDTTERRVAEEHLRHSEERFRALADNISQLAWMADEQGRGVWFNRRWYEYTGATPEDSLGANWRRFQHPEHLERVADKFLMHIEAGTEWEDTFPLRGRDGTYRWFLSRATPIRDDQGNITRWFGTNTDITEQMQAQQELQRLADELRSANADLLQFASIASHDLKEPLRGIAHLAAFIKEDAPATLGPEAAHRLDRIQTLCARLSQMVDGLLLYSRTGTEPRMEDVDLNDVIARVVDTCAEQLAEAGAAVILRGRLPTVRGDRLLLERAFANLVSNAVKFNESAEKRVVIAPEGDAVAIRDNGIGIDPRHHETIFRVFRRAASGGKYGGTGLGLALVKRILERHNGRIEVESTPGHGATFRVYLPPIAPGAAGAERLLTAHAPDGSVR